MLSRTADHLFWMARYMERAESTARMLDVHHQTALLPHSVGDSAQSWQRILSISELMPAYTARYGEANVRKIQAFCVSDEANPSSILNCLRATRENARAVRGTLPTEVWETTNQTWLEFKRMVKDGQLARDPAAVFEWVKFRSHLLGGVSISTMLQDDALHFMRIGTFLERADNTARLLDIKFHDTQPEAVVAERDPAQDFYHWSAILRAVSAFETYRKVYSNVIQPEKVAELLMLRPNMPRSLAHCMSHLLSNLKKVSDNPGSETLRQAGKLHAELQFGRIDEILSGGLHDFLTVFMDRVGELGQGISRDFLITATEPGTT